MGEIKQIAERFEKYLEDTYKSKTFNEELFFDFCNFNYHLEENDFWEECGKISKLYEQVRAYILKLEYTNTSIT